MSLKRRVISVLDRPGGRWLLGRLATAEARRASGADVAVLFDEGWVHRSADRYFPDGQSFDYREPDFRRWPGEYERQRAAARDYWFRCYTPRFGDTIVDVGAGRGEDLGAFSEAVGPSGRVYSIEAHPESFDRLARFARLNGLDNVVAVHAAISDRAGEAYICDADSWEANDIHAADEGAGRPVPMMTLGDVRRQFGVASIDFLKMNIEGAERQALSGMVQDIRAVRNICVACHDFRADRGDGEQFRTRDFVEEFLLDHGFELHSQPDHPEDFARDHLFGRRKANG